MRKKHVEKKLMMRVCTKCTWKGMKYTKFHVQGTCDMCGKVRGVYFVRSFNLQ